MFCTDRNLSQVLQSHSDGLESALVKLDHGEGRGFSGALLSLYRMAASDEPDPDCRRLAGALALIHFLEKLEHWAFCDRAKPQRLFLTGFEREAVRRAYLEEPERAHMESMDSLKVSRATFLVMAGSALVASSFGAFSALGGASLPGAPTLSFSPIERSHEATKTQPGAPQNISSGQLKQWGDGLQDSSTPEASVERNNLLGVGLGALAAAAAIATRAAFKNLREVLNDAQSMEIDRIIYGRLEAHARQLDRSLGSLLTLIVRETSD